jgi:hypothetical protein
VDLIAALFAIATAYLAYTNYVIIKRARARATSPLIRHLVLKGSVALAAYSLATILFVISATASWRGGLFLGIFATAVSGVSSSLFLLVRPRQQ